MHPGRVEGKHSTGPGEASEKCGQAQDRGSQTKNWRPSLCQGEVLQNQATIQETLRKEPGPIRHDRETRHPLRPPGVGGISVCCKTRLQVPDSRVRAWSH